jgi:hypothetical protein
MLILALPAGLHQLLRARTCLIEKAPFSRSDADRQERTEKGLDILVRDAAAARFNQVGSRTSASPQ